VVGENTGMNTWLASTRDTFKSQLWPAPVIAVVAALLFGVSLRSSTPRSTETWVDESDLMSCVGKRRSVDPRGPPMSRILEGGPVRSAMISCTRMNSNAPWAERLVSLTDSSNWLA